MKKFIRIIALTLALTVVLALTGCAKTDNTVLRVGMECNYSPYNWTQTDDSNGAVAIEGGGYAGGYDVEIAKIIANGLSRKLVIVQVDWGNLAQSANSGKIDAIIAGMSPILDRQVKLEFTQKYYTATVTVVVKKDGPYAAATNLSGFAGAKLTSQEGTTHYSMINQLEGADKQVQAVDYPSMIATLADGTIDGYVADIAAAKSAVAANPDFAYITFAEGQGFDTEESGIAICVGLKKRNNFYDDMNAIIKNITDAQRETLMDAAIANQPVK